MSRSNSRPLAGAIHRLLTGSLTAGASMLVASAPAWGQTEMGEIVVTGTRITMPGVVSSSPIYSVTAAEIALQQQPEVEKIVRILPITVPGDGQNVNNGTGGASTVNLRGLGAQRNLIMIDGKRLVPYDYNGQVDTSMIPTALIERLDIVTGGASAVYGSDAISGALNFITKRDFEGVEIESNFSQTGEKDGDIKSVSATVGGNFVDGRGNMVISMNWAERTGVLYGARPLGQLGIDTASGAGYQEFLDGLGPTPPSDPQCTGPGSVATGGSTTTLPTRVSIAGGPGLGQFRNDGTLAGNCSVFNFNPFNYYQTPQTRYGGAVVGHLELSEHAEAYTRLNYGNTSVNQQVAPSGVFGTPFWTPLANPLIGSDALTDILAMANAGVGAGTVLTGGGFPNWRDINNNGVVDAADELNIVYRRRTVEFGARSSSYNNENFQFLLGSRGRLAGDWDYDVAGSYGETHQVEVRAGYTNLTNIGNALRTADGVTCLNGDPTCVPINLFGGFGAITPQMAAYSSATATLYKEYEQVIVTGSVTGPVNGVQLPWADSPLALSFGAEYRDESATTIPDECLKLAPSSCLGGAGGNVLPISGGYRVNELFGEALVPIASDKPGIVGLDLELGYRWSDYNLTGSDGTWKAGLNWRPVDQLLVRVMQQKAARAPNVGELASPTVTGLDNAQMDPCSIANAGNIDATLQALCISTGMTAAQVGTVEDIVSGQVNTIEGTDVNVLPSPESADTFTAGLVWTPNFGGRVNSATFSIDYYKIDIEDWIGEFTAQEVLDGCYTLGFTAECAKIQRIGGGLTIDGSGVELFTTNLNFLNAEGIEVGFALGFDIGRFGTLSFNGQINHYLSQESQSADTAPVIECAGFYGTSCGLPISEDRWVQRTTWDYNDFTASMLWRHLSSTKVEAVEASGTFEAFRSIPSYDYLDLYFGYRLWDKAQVSLSVVNVFEEHPPIVGNESGSTTFNSGNTYPSNYDTLGRVYTVGLNVKF
ncbi:MAG: TonB-dependent receptor [Steroidobacteraceae bacterium]